MHWYATGQVFMNRSLRNCHSNSAGVNERPEMLSLSQCDVDFV